MKKRIIKRLTSGAVLTSLLISAMAVPACAAKDDEPYTLPKVETRSYSSMNTGGYSMDQLQDSVIEFGELEVLVQNYNTSVIGNRYTYQGIRDSYEDAESSEPAAAPAGGGYGDSDRVTDKAIKDINDKLSDYNSDKRDLQNEINKMPDGPEKTSKENQLNTIENTIITLNSQKGSLLSISELNNTMNGLTSSMGNASGMSASDVRNYYLQFTQAEATMIKSVQGLYPTYYQLSYNIDQMNANLELLEKTLEGKKLQRDLGMCTDDDVASAEVEVASMKSNISSLENQMKSIVQQICVLVGREYNENIQLGALPEIDYEYLDGIDAAYDADRAVGLNYGVRNKVNAQSNYGPGTSYSTRQADNYALAAERENVKNSVNAQYITVQNAKSALAVEQQKLESIKKTTNQAEAKYNLGMISLLEYENQKNNYVNQEVAVKTAESKLLEAVNTYQWYLKGLS